MNIAVFVSVNILFIRGLWSFQVVCVVNIYLDASEPVHISSIFLEAIRTNHMTREVPSLRTVKFADYYGKIRLIMLHKPEIADQSTCFALKTCNANSASAMNPYVSARHSESFSTPDGSVNHFMAVKSMILKQFVAVCKCDNSMR